MLRKTGRQRKMKYCMVSCIRELKEKRKNVKNGFMYRENTLVDTKNRRVGWMHDGGRKVPISIYIIRKLKGCSVQNGGCREQYSIVYLKVVKK